MSIRKLSAEESKTLYSLLKAEQRPLEDVVTDFNSKIPRQHHFTFCSCIVWLLEASQPNPLYFLLFLSHLERMVVSLS